MNLRKNPRWQTIVFIMVVVGILILALGGYLSPVTSFLLSPVFSIQGWITTRYQALQDMFNAPTDLAILRQRNAELEAEISDLQTQILSLQQQVTEVEILSALLDFARYQPQNEYQAASVIYRDPSPFMKYIVINIGSDDGIRSGMPVVSAEGLVGRVDAVIASAARVQLITDPLSQVNVQIQPANTDAVLIGSITGDLTLDLIPQDSEIKSGDLILTSGFGGQYPPNILIGQVASVRGEATELFLTADFSRIEIVLVIINFRPVDITPLLPEETE
jgi:rod shape-determining protein MreC